MEACLYCEKNQATTNDHVPPKGLFPDPKPSDLLTVPACLECNQGYMQDDEYFRVAMAAQAAYREPNATIIWREKIVPRLNRDPLIVRPNRRPLRTKILQSMIRTSITTPAGIKTGEVLAIPFDIARTERVVKRTVQGLLWALYKRRLSLNCPMQVFINPKIPGNEELRELLYGLELRSIGQIFQYRHGLTVDGSDSSIWWLQFYGGPHFVVIAGRPALED
jgi:hypothetical protein